MGPHFFKCGKPLAPGTTTEEWRASMGPHFFKCGKADDLYRASHRFCGFNGAALFQVRKEGIRWRAPRDDFRLQWGRTFSSAESATEVITIQCGIELQWGRTFSSAESFYQSGLRLSASGASMGPHFFKCGKGNIRVFEKRPKRASMGPHFFKCGKMAKRFEGVDHWIASMGPHFFKCGKGREIGQRRKKVSRLQWGRTFSSAESWYHLAVQTGWELRFNGAALFQVRKGLRMRLLADANLAASMGPHFFKCGKITGTLLGELGKSGFNGAALFQVRKVNLYERQLDQMVLASMGPHFFKCGKGASWVQGTQAAAGFNGAALFQVRKEPRRDSASLSVSSFNGAALFQVRKVKNRATRYWAGAQLQWGRTFSSAESSQHPRR